MTTEYLRVTGLADLFARARELSVSTMILDVEPLVAPWRGNQEALDWGIARILGGIRTVPSVRVVVFATNSARRPSAVPACDGLEVRYLASADEPLRTAPYHGLPRPGAVAGDQVPTTGCSPTGSVYVPALHAAAGRRPGRARAHASVGRIGAPAAVPAAVAAGSLFRMTW
jgi:hypothetical protein